MAEDTVNGIQLLLDEIDMELDNKRIGKRDRLHLRCNQYLLKSLIPIRQSVNTLQKNDLFQWAKDHPKPAIIMIILYHSFLISDIRQPFFNWISSMIGIIMKAL